jgi:hypothetical protein
MLDIAVVHASSIALRPADFAAIGELRRHVRIEQILDFQLQLVGQLVAIGTEELDAVVVERIVRGRDHHAEIGAQRPRQHGDGGCRHRAEHDRHHADGGETGATSAFPACSRSAAYPCR